MATQRNLLDAALHHAAFGVLTDRAFLRITGADGTRWLNGMVTNAVQALAPGEGNYSFLLNSQGRIQGDCTLYREHTPSEPSFLLATDAAQLDTLTHHLDRFIIMDDVELTPVLADQSSLLLLGPESSSLLAGLDLPSPAPLRLTDAGTPHGPVLLLTVQNGAHFELRAPLATLNALQRLLEAKNIPEVDAETLEQLRIVQSIPRYGTDIRDRELPQQTAQTHALHFSKGCYLGQEIVERIHSRGQVNRLFTPLRLHGSLPTLPATLEADGRTVGEITSAAQVDLPTGTELLALGYVRREALTAPASGPNTGVGAHVPGTPLNYSGGTATPRPKQ